MCLLLSQDAKDEKEIYRKEAEALKRKDLARTQHMNAQSQSAKAGAQGLQGQLQELNNQIHELQAEVREAKLKALDQERAAMDLEARLRDEKKGRGKAETKCARLEEELAAEREKARAAQALQLKLGGPIGEAAGEMDCAEKGLGMGGMASAKTKAELRKRDLQIRDLSHTIQENEGRVAYLEAKIQEKDRQLQLQVGTMMKMDSDVDRLVKCINDARDKLVEDIRSSLWAVFDVAKAEERMLLDTVVRENRFFQTRIGQHLLLPRVSKLEGLISEALSIPVELKLETAFTFPS
eukprot:scaffold15890_cov26-Prasinocladus_malaysianus.AAC.1